MNLEKFVTTFALIVNGGGSVADVSRKTGYSKSWIYQLTRKLRKAGVELPMPRSQMHIGVIDVDHLNDLLHAL